jgi:hypothetical protein
MKLEQAHAWAEYALELFESLVDELEKQNTYFITVLTPYKIVTIYADVACMVEAVLQETPVAIVTKRWIEAIVHLVMYLSNARPISQIDYAHIKRGNL